jgi:hypothetical protein
MDLSNEITIACTGLANSKNNFNISHKMEIKSILGYNKPQIRKADEVLRWVNLK